MQLKRTLLPVVVGAMLFQGGGMLFGQAEATVDSAWRQRCSSVGGWNFCFAVPPASDEQREGSGFKEVQKYDGRHMQFSPWVSWTGRHWDELIADVTESRNVLDSTADEDLLAWAGLWDSRKRAEHISSGHAASGTPKAFKTDVFVDSRGRRWAYGVRKSRELNIPYTRVEQVFVMPIEGGRLRLEVSMRCSHPHPHCRFVDRMVSGVTWSNQD